MQELPTEVQQEILLNVPLTSLREACASSSQFNYICHSRSFWVRKFEKAGLPRPARTLQERTLQEWFACYTSAIQARDKTDEIIHEMEQGKEVFYSISLNEIRDPRILLVPGFSLETIEELLELKREYLNVRSEIDYLEELGRKDRRHPEEQERLEVLYSIPDVEAEITSENGIVTYLFTIYKEDGVTKEFVEAPVREFPDLWELLYRLNLKKLLYRRY